MYDNSSKNGFFKAKSRIFVTIDYLDMYPSHLWWLPSPESSAVFSKLLDFFTCPWKIFFSNFFQLLWENWPRMTIFFFIFFGKKTSNINSNWMMIFPRIFLRIYVGPKIKKLEIRSNFRDFFKSRKHFSVFFYLEYC